MTLKRVLTSALAVVLALSCLLCAGCSTPEVAMEVGGKTYTMGEYLAYVFATLQTDYNASIYLSYLGEEALDMDMTYGEGDDAKEVSMKEYIVLSATDMVIRQAAIEELLAENELKWDAELEKDAREALKTMTEDQYLSLGFSNESYSNMYLAYTLNEASLFKGFYNEGGKREVKEEEIRDFFEKNYLSYYMFELSLVDSDKKALSDEIIADYQKHFDEYLKKFNRSKKTAEDFQEIYRQFKADTAEEEKKDETTSSSTTTTGTTTTTTAKAAETTVTDTDKDDKKEEEKKEETSRVDVVKTADGVDEALIKAIEKIDEGSAQVVTYKKNGETNTLALIFRVDPESDRKDDKGKDIDYFKENIDQTLQHMKYDEFDAEIKARMEKLRETAVINKSAQKAVDILELAGLK